MLCSCVFTASRQSQVKWWFHLHTWVDDTVITEGIYRPEMRRLTFLKQMKRSCEWTLWPGADSSAGEVTLYCEFTGVSRIPNTHPQSVYQRLTCRVPKATVLMMAGVTERTGVSLRSSSLTSTPLWNFHLHIKQIERSGHWETFTRVRRVQTLQRVKLAQGQVLKP